jgi:hypothetical protein
MPKVQCTCGEVLSFSGIPSPVEWRIISDVKFDRFAGQVDAEAIYRGSDMMLKCPQCGRLWVFWEGADDPIEYVPQKGRPPSAGSV